MITCVVCTGRKGKVTDRIKEGINVYRVRLLWLRDGDADQVLREAEEQYRRGNLLACIATVQGVTVTYDPNGILEENIT